LIEAAKNTNFRDGQYDCSEIAEDLLQAADGKGKIIEVTPDGDALLKLFENGKTTNREFYYHQVYTDGSYVYDPRLDNRLVAK
jgi:filamentous hemagglutinin